MSSLNLNPGSAPPATCRPLELAVVAEGQTRHDLHVRQWSRRPGPDFGQAVIALAMAGRTRPARHAEDLADLPPVGSRVRIVPAECPDQVLFDGAVTGHGSRLDEQGEELLLHVTDWLALRLGGPLIGRWQVSDGTAVFVPTHECIFNQGGHGLASRQAHELAGRPVRIFEPGDGEPWSIGQILDYLLAAHVPADVAAPSPEQLAGLAPDFYPARLDLTGLPVAKALAKAAGLAGLAWRSTATAEAGLQRGLELYSLAGGGPARTVALQPAGDALDLRRSNLWQGRIVVRRRPNRRPVLVLGRRKLHESTFALQPGWDRSLESYHYESFVRGRSDDWPALDDVFRKWVLNEGGQYAGPPWNLPLAQLSQISSDDFLVYRPRRLEPCLSHDRSGQSLGVVVEFSPDSGQTWRRYAGSVCVANDECSLHLSDDALGGDYFAAAVAGTVQVRVTATVAADRRLSAQVDGDGGPALFHAAPNAGWAAVSEGSIFSDRDELGEPAECDDSDYIEQLARQFSQAAGGSLEAELTLAWLAPQADVGEAVELLGGRDLALELHPAGGRPVVGGVEHDAGENWCTKLVLNG